MVKTRYYNRSTPRRKWREKDDSYNSHALPGSNMVAIGDAIKQWRTSSGESVRMLQFDQLWRNWNMVMGKFLAPVAHPLGHREGILLIGAEDNFIMQELTYATPEMLERANAFMGKDEFLRVELQLLQGRVPLNRIQTADYPPLPPPQKPEHLGTLMGLLSPSSPVGKAYAAYVRLFEELKKEQ